MGATLGRPKPSLAERLHAEPYRFNFFQAVRLLECWGAPTTVAVGRAGPPAREAVRLAAGVGLAFPASDIDSVDPPRSPGRPRRLRTSFIGLTGPSGVLPRFYTELVRRRAGSGESALGAFLDVFNHRLISLFYRAWREHCLMPDADNPGDDRLAAMLFPLIGMGLPSLRGRHSIPDSFWLRNAGVLARGSRPAAVLEDMLCDHFGLPVEVAQFAGRWLQLGPDVRSTLGTSGRHGVLGVDLVLGGRVRDAQGAIRLRLGPLSLDQFRRFLPSGPGFRPLVEMTRLFVGAALDVDVQLVLRSDEVPASRLTKRPGDGIRLGRLAWLTKGGAWSDRDDVVIACGE